MLWLILSLLGAAGVSPRFARTAGASLLGLVPLAGALWLIFGLDGGTLYELPWFTALGADIVLLADPLGRSMAVLVLGVGAAIVFYAQTYLKEDPQRGRCLAILFAFMASMVGVVLSDNVLLLFVFWELTSVTSYLLIGYKHEDKKARGHALQALLVTGFGGVAMLVGLLLLVAVTGTWRLSEMTASAALIREAPTYPAILVLLQATLEVEAWWLVAVALGVGLGVWYSSLFDVEVALLLALLGFVATIAFARLGAQEEEGGAHE